MSKQNGFVADDIELAEFPEAVAECFYKLAGQFAKGATAKTEADPIAVLFTLLTRLGCYYGRNATLWHGGIPFPPKLFTVLVGLSSKGRKGTSVFPVARLFELVDDILKQYSIDPAPIADATVSSGEGLVFSLRDPSGKEDADTGKPADPGVIDKRLFILEEEFGGQLKVGRRDGSSVSPVLRKSWDYPGNYRFMTKQQPIQMSKTHVCLVGHTSPDELRKQLTSTEAANGFANRFAWVATRRSKVLSRPQMLSEKEMKMYAVQLTESIRFAASLEDGVRMSEAALDVWDGIYYAFANRIDTGGIKSGLTHRAEAYVLRIACILAVTQQSAVVEPEHIRAAKALWDYVESSIEYVFGADIDEDEQRIIQFLGQHGATGSGGDNRQPQQGEVRQTEIHNQLFSNHSATLYSQLQSLEERGMVVRRKVATGGRPATFWRLVQAQ